MSTVTLADTVTTGTVYGTLAAATTYITGSYGDPYTAWLALTADNKKRTLIAAARFLDRQSWVALYDTFAERDALEAFQLASYELAALAADDPDVLTAADQSTNVSRVYAGGAGVDFANPTSVRGGTASLLPPVLMALIGQYLSTSSTSGPDGGSGETGSCRNPFDSCSDYDRKDPW